MIELVRVGSSSAGTFGVWCRSSVAFALALELPWFDNAQNRSDIPAGLYICRRRHSPHFGYDVFEVCDVPGRTAIEIHPANKLSDLLGCIGIGEEFATTGGPVLLTDSQRAFKAFMASMDGLESFPLHIFDPPQGTLAA